MDLKKIYPFFYTNSLRPYTAAWYAVVISRNGTATRDELDMWNDFEATLGASQLSEGDRLWHLALADPIAARTSFFNPTSSIMEAVNSPTHSSGFGYTGNGDNSYLNTKFNAATQGVKFTRNSNAMFFYSRTNSSSATIEMGATDATNKCFTSLNAGAYPNNMSTGAGSPSIAIANTTGLFWNERTGSTSSALYRNNSLLQTSAIASTGLVNNENFLGSVNLGGTPLLFSSRQYSLAGFVSGATNKTNYYTAIQELGTNKGWWI